MTSLGLLLLFSLSFVGSLHACSCGSLSWATCDESSCECYINVGEQQRQILNCSTMIPKCFLMKAEMYRLKHPSSSQNKPSDTALADSHELYDPECEPSGLFKAKQCNNTDVCWCVDSAGVRRSDKGDRNLKCEELVETNRVHVQLKHKNISRALQSAIASAIQEQYKTDQQLDSKSKAKYDVDARLIILDVKDDTGDWDQDLSGLAYYMEEDVKVQSLLDDQMKLQPTVVDQQMEMESVLVYYKGEKAPTGGMRRLTAGILTVTVVVILSVLVGLLILFLIRRQKRGKYEKAQTTEIEEI